MDTAQFLAAVHQLADEKNLPEDKIMDVVQDAFRTAYRKEYGNRDEEIEVEIDKEHSSVTILLVKQVVADDEIENEDLEIGETEAKKLNKKLEIGDTVKIDVTPTSYGRIAAQSAKQVIIQRIQEAERDAMYEAYKDHEDEVLQAVVNRADGRNVYIDLDKASTVLTPPHQIPNEHYRPGLQIKVYLEKVNMTAHGPEFVISRSHPNLVRELFRLEIPEIQNGAVEVKAVAREAGVRTKIAVASNENGVDPIGACVGQKGVRIQSVMEELNGERIDVIEWSDNPEKFMRAALAPAQITKVNLDKNSKRAAIFVTEDQRALAIGRSGQNVRLAGILTGWEIDVMNVEDLPEGERTQLVHEAVMSGIKLPSVENISDLEGIDDETLAILMSAGFEKVMQLTGLSAQALQGIDGIDEKKAKEIEQAVIAGKTKHVEAVVAAAEQKEPEVQEEVLEAKEEAEAADAEAAKKVKE